MTVLSRLHTRHIIIAWTDDLPETFAKAYEGEDLLANVPELIWERADKIPSVIRYHYHDHVCERFVQAFAIDMLCANFERTKRSAS